MLEEEKRRSSLSLSDKPAASSHGLLVKSCEIIGSKSTEEAVYYIVKVYTKSDENWTCIKRYSQFEEFHANLLECVNEHGLPAGAELPGKKLKIWVPHDEPSHVKERELLLENYLKKLVSVKDVAESDLFVGFLCTDKVNLPAEVRGLEPCKEDLSDVSDRLPEDVEVTSITIPTVRIMPDHVLYQVDVTNERKRKSFQKWTVLKRFQQFADLDSKIREEFVDNLRLLEDLPSLPDKFSKLLYDHMDDHFIEQRRVLLEHFLQRLMITNPIYYSSNFLSFLGIQT